MYQKEQKFHVTETANLLTKFCITKTIKLYVAEIINILYNKGNHNCL